MKFDPPCRSCVVAMVLILVACTQAQEVDAPPPPQVSTVRVTLSQLDLTEDLPGRVEPVRLAEIRPQISGIVQRRLFEQGREVRAGQPLFQIDPAPFIAERDTAAAALSRAEAALARAQVQTQRLQPLMESEAVSRQLYDDAVSQRDQAGADVAQARAALARRQLDLKYATVDAPISGRIDQTLVSEGALVSSTDSQAMARIQQIDSVYVDVRRPASSLEALLRVLGTRAAEAGKELPVSILRSTGEAYDAVGKVLFSGINVDAGTGDVLLRIQVDNPKRQLLPGMFVRARVPLARYAEAIVLPQQAVVRVGGKPHVWMIDAQNLAHQIPVELGELIDGNYRIASGLQQGQCIAVEGMERIVDGAPVTPREASVLPHSLH